MAAPPFPPPQMEPGSWRLLVHGGRLTLWTAPRTCYVFSRDGHLAGAHVDGHSFRRAWDNRLLERWTGPDGRRQRRWWRPEEAEPALAAVHETVRAGWRRALGRAGGPGEEPAAGAPDGLAAWLERIAAIGREEIRARAEAYRMAYPIPVGILPPDQYGAVVLQLTEGCAWNRCTFCTFYRGRPYRVKQPEAFARHLELVARLFGEALADRPSVFLGDANALGAPYDRLVDALRQIQTRLPPPAGVPPGREPPWEVASFVDVFTRAPATRAQWEELHRLGLRRVYVGVESGSPAVLRFLHKPVEPDRVLALVTAAKGAGVAVGLIFLLGAGGRALAEAHVAETLALLGSLPLDERDTVYLSELVAEPGGAYEQAAARAGVEPLSPAELRAQGEAIRRGLRRHRSGVRVSRYDIREFLYG